ncbi:hypothetical protein BOSE62_80011 [Bosea sp. 62]|nr:hypothetical protein BOSE21B_80151 [Bosea sp. 21B]CAD5293201.1 hypothetical protein BOSE46_80118 [Bosea sp. 46]CAD5299765.1 hypothetical protein BOSE7B_60660 [Bosea sp. 7B]VVT57013.1 hypothetical protein BOS5A_180010 [Bosea sp. EC-HK365B]VXC70657.1 hypothetical protein BOSE29B_70123 [Bosea sp. 29B]VXC86029.1 hypothetical protein BOSE125_600003 [Bosea sp. 125]VXC94950.1 hypothetical protein BOSE62_80011 [Bosea sp. 62]
MDKAAALEHGSLRGAGPQLTDRPDSAVRAEQALARRRCLSFGGVSRAARSSATCAWRRRREERRQP